MAAKNRRSSLTRSRLNSVFAERMSNLFNPLVTVAVERSVQAHLGPAVQTVMDQTIDTKWRRYLALALLTSRATPVDLTAAECRVFSQNGEDGVVHALLERLEVEPFFVEFGAGTGAEGNCVLLAEAFGWRGVFADAAPSNFAALENKYAGYPGIATACRSVSPETVESFLRSHQVPVEFGILSIDVDGLDYWIWDALDAYRPAIVVIEYNGAYPVRDHRVPDRTRTQWRGEPDFGASLAAMVDLGARKGYDLVHTDLTGVNAFFVRSDKTGKLPSGDAVPWRAARHLASGQGFDGVSPEYFERD